MEEAGTAGGNHPPTLFKIIMQKMEQMELQARVRDAETGTLLKEFINSKKEK